MCGRYTLSAGESEILERFEVLDVFMETQLVPRFNIAPTQDVSVIVSLDGRRTLTTYKWGLVPFWVKDLATARPMINARGETLPEKPFFKTALTRRRCIIPADGFFEWQSRPGVKGKTPMWIHLDPLAMQEAEPAGRTDKPVLFGFAGLYDRWKRPDGSYLETCTIITTGANQVISPVHDRMPVILSRGAEAIWLDEANKDPQELMQVLHACPDNVIKMHPVSSKVNKPGAQGADLIEHVPPGSEPAGDPDITADGLPKPKTKRKAAVKVDQTDTDCVQITLPGFEIPKSD